MIALTLETIDQETDCVTARFPLDISDLNELIGLSASSLPDTAFSEDAEEEDDHALSEIALKQVYERYVGDRPPSDAPLTGILRRRHRIDNLSYFIHTNGELPLMLMGTKPLACFCFGAGEEEAQHSVLRPFAPHVENGTFLKYDFSIQTDMGCCINYITYSLKGEEWRAKAMELLKRSGRLSGWNESLERLEGSLLGYTDAQNDEYLARIYRPQKT
ncbi:MAG: hypothetical protein AAGC58_07685 [Asticcacaulis sp.]